MSKNNVFSNDAQIKESEDKISWVKKAIAGDEKAKNQIYEQYYKMIKLVVSDFFMKDGNNYSTSMLEFEDYEQEVWCYLFNNLHKYDPTRSKLSTFIYWRAEACLRRYRENCARTIRYPVYKVQLFNRMKKFSIEYEAKYNKIPTQEILEAEFEVTQKEINQYSEYIGNNLISLEEKIYEDDDRNTFHSTLSSNEDIEKDSMSNILMDEIRDTIFNCTLLKDQQKEIIKLWLFDEESDAEICNKINIKKSVLSREKTKIRTQLKEILIDFKKII